MIFRRNSHYITEHTTIEEVREWFKEAFVILLDDVFKDCPWLVENPAIK